MIVAAAYDYVLFEERSFESGLDCEDVSLTKQSFKEEADINTIVNRFGISGQLPQDVRMPMYGDFTGVGDFREALHAIREAEESFMAMPANVRAKFGNDPAVFVEWCGKEENRAEAVALGLVEKPMPPAPPVKVVVVPEDPGKGVPQASSSAGS